MRAFAILLAVLTLTGCREQPAPPPAQTSSALRPLASVVTAPGPRPPANTWPREKPLTLLTYNVLATPIYSELRTEAVLAILEKSDAHIIALQEVDDWFLNALVAAPWVKAGYHHSSENGRPFAPGGQLILAKQPLESVSVMVMPGRQRRVLMIAELVIGGRRLAVATTHMESFLDDGPTRAEQLRGIFGLLKGADDALLLGDLNFGDGAEPETAALDAAYVDLWSELRAGDAGFTWNMKDNPLAQIGAFIGEPDRRLDRMLMRTDAWRPTAIEIIGNAAIGKYPLTEGQRKMIAMPGRPAAPNTVEIEVFPSDHYGLSAAIVPR